MLRGPPDCDESVCKYAHGVFKSISLQPAFKKQMVEAVKENLGSAVSWNKVKRTGAADDLFGGLSDDNSSEDSDFKRYNLNKKRVVLPSSSSESSGSDSDYSSDTDGSEPPSEVDSDVPPSDEPPSDDPPPDGEPPLGAPAPPRPPGAAPGIPGAPGVRSEYHSQGTQGVTQEFLDEGPDKRLRPCHVRVGCGEWKSGRLLCAQWTVVRLVLCKRGHSLGWRLSPFGSLGFNYKLWSFRGRY